jgi:hypothetical protein
VSIANKIGKKYGTKAGFVDLPGAGKASPEGNGWESTGSAHDAATVHSLDIPPEMARDAMQGMTLLFQPAYHGTPHRFDKFTTDHMGSGEGAQAYGWGLYFAGSKEVGKYYKDTLGKEAYHYDGKKLDPDSVEYLAAQLLKGNQGDKAQTIDDLKAALVKAGAALAIRPRKLSRQSRRWTMRRSNKGGVSTPSTSPTKAVICYGMRRSASSPKQLERSS